MEAPMPPTFLAAWKMPAATGRPDLWSHWQRISVQAARGRPSTHHLWPGRACITSNSNAEPFIQVRTAAKFKSPFVCLRGGRTPCTWVVPGLNWYRGTTLAGTGELQGLLLTTVHVPRREVLSNEGLISLRTVSRLTSGCTEGLLRSLGSCKNGTRQ